MYPGCWGQVCVSTTPAALAVLENADGMLSIESLIICDNAQDQDPYVTCGGLQTIKLDYTQALAQW